MASLVSVDNGLGLLSIFFAVLLILDVLGRSCSKLPFPLYACRAMLLLLLALLVVYRGTNVWSYQV